MGPDELTQLRVKVNACTPVPTGSTNFHQVRRYGAAVLVEIQQAAKWREGRWTRMPLSHPRHATPMR